MAGIVDLLVVSSRWMGQLSLKFKNLSQLSRQKREWIDHQDGQLHQYKDQFEFHCSSKKTEPRFGVRVSPHVIGDLQRAFSFHFIFRGGKVNHF
jgi:hypothetical protein